MSDSSKIEWTDASQNSERRARVARGTIGGCRHDARLLGFG
ncbi:MAG TPA: hypothetical protein VMF53_06670 [Alphaproteobacteria bacterium]|nr:hypothetical protein [Alphaproteobacteria bacterium]